MTKPKKAQKPAYVVSLSPKKEFDESQSQGKSLLGDPPNAPPMQSDHRRASDKRTGHSPFGRQAVRERQSRFKTAAGPARSLMSIDFSSMGFNTLDSLVTSRTLSRNRRSNYSSDDDSYSDSRSDWKRGRKHQNLKASASGSNVSSTSEAAWRKQQLRPSHAPLIVDMRQHSASSDTARSYTQPKPLLDSVSHKPASLMDFKSKGSRPHSTDRQESFSRHDRYPSQPSPPKSFLPGGRREDPPRKRMHQPGNSDAPERKAFKPEQSQKPQPDQEPRLRMFTGRGRTFVIIPVSCATTYLHGRAKVTVLDGNVTILTYKLEEGTPYDVFSPTAGSLLALNCTGGARLNAQDVRKKLVTFGVPQSEKELENIGSTTVAVLMLSKLESTACDYITSFIPYTQLFTAPVTREKDSHSLRGVTSTKLGLKLAPMKEMGPMCLTMSQDYEDVLARFTAQLSKSSTSSKTRPVWLCCGARNSGKSTFCRRLINTALKSVKAVGYLECDVGQTEFSPPATLSFHIIDKPILGQPFCHQRHAERMVFYGETAANHDPSMYVKCLKYVFAAYKGLEETLPLVVNTMGYPEGIGLMLMIDTVQLVQPDIVVQIESQNQAANFPAVTHELVALDEGWTCNKSPITQITDPRSKMEDTHAHELILLPTLLNQRREFSLKLKPIDLRNLSLLASLSLGLEPGLTLTTVAPVTVSYRQLAMHVCHHRLTGTDILAAVEASVVALCTADISQTYLEDEGMPRLFNEMPVCHCHGLAIVRAVDKQRGLLYLVTGLPRARLMEVNTVLKGCLALPDQIILKQKTAGTSPLPYVDALAPSTGVSAVRPRARMPRLTLGAHQSNS